MNATKLHHSFFASSKLRLFGGHIFQPLPSLHPSTFAQHWDVQRLQLEGAVQPSQCGVPKAWQWGNCWVSSGGLKPKEFLLQALRKTPRVGPVLNCHIVPPTFSRSGKFGWGHLALSDVVSTYLYLHTSCRPQCCSLWQWPSAPTLSMRRRLGPCNTWVWGSWRSKLHNSAYPSPSHPGCAPTSSVHLPIKWQDVGVVN